MSKGRKILFLSVVLVALAALLALFVVTTARNYSPRTKRLPDGSWLRIVSVSYGQRHSYALTAPKPWQLFLAKHISAAWTTRLGWWNFGAGSVSSGARPGESNLGVITICDAAARPGFRPFQMQLAVCDLEGHTYGMADRGTSSIGNDGTYERRLVCWTLSPVTREKPSLRLQFSQLAADGTTWQPVAEFIVANPAANAPQAAEKAAVR